MRRQQNPIQVLFLKIPRRISASIGTEKAHNNDAHPDPSNATFF